VGLAIAVTVFAGSARRFNRTDIVHAQILLDRAHFSPGEIDGTYGDNLRVAVEGYQADRKLHPTGTLDAETLTSLAVDTAPVFVDYTITDPDVKGPFHPVPAGMMQQAKLETLGFASPEVGLGERFLISPKLLAALNPGKSLSKAGEQISVPNVERGAPAAAERIVVSKARRSVTAYGPGNVVLAHYPATIGSEHDPLPIGDWKVTVVQHNPAFYYNPALFWDATPDQSKARIAPGPNNPVGVVWIGLSKEHYGIHGAPDPGAIGHAESHGCIRLTNWDASELSHMVRKGTPVQLQE
jgi:lipoprotein-anchoring transpeptidase ErfK/SrfK